MSDLIRKSEFGSEIRTTTVVCLSDTHNLHRDYGRPPFGEIPPGDIIIHAGDVTTHGSMEELEVFLAWFGSLSHQNKIFIAGNHDRCLERDEGRARMKEISGITYLENSGCLIKGLKIWGSPYTPRHQDFAFQLDGEEEARKNWSHSWDELDILITHGPPQGILDRGAHAGCPELLSRCSQIKPRIHVFGHDHDDYGMALIAGTVFINASVHSWLWKQTRPMHPFVVSMACL